MKGFKVLFSILIMCSMSVFSQKKNIQHSIVKGETISSIAQKYKVTAASIYKLNPKAKKTLHLNQVLIIPISDSKNTNEIVAVPEKKVELNHEVLPKETLYGITKQYKTTTELLYKANPNLEIEGLKIGQSIIIPTTGLSKKEIKKLSNAKSEEVVVSTQALTHEVKPKESLYVIAKQYGISLKELKEANPKIGKKGLSIGQLITIPENGKAVAETAVEKSAAIEAKESTVSVTATPDPQKTSDTQNKGAEIVHQVLPKETKYRIAKKYGITVAALEEQNPDIKQKLLVGSKLIIRSSDSNTVVNNSAVTTAESEEIAEKIEINKNIGSAILAEQLIQTASENIGSRYRTGGTTKSGFDCSGLMCSTFSAFDIKLPRSSIEQSSFGTRVDSDEAQKGDLIFFKTNGRSRINHVGMVVEVCDGEIKFIHSSVHSGVIISSTKEKYYEKNFVQLNRVLE
jgi:cell wall-associated NlpC family hydrolase